MNLRTFVLVAIAGLLVTGQKCPNASICATGEEFVNGKCVCKPNHVPDSDGKGCHVEEPPTTTTSSTTTTTTAPPLPTTTTTTTTFPPSPGPTCPKMPECASGESSPGVYGCCTVNNIGSSPWTQAVEDTLDDYIRDHGTAVIYQPADPPEVAEQKETAFVKDITARMRAKGHCVTNKSETPGGGTSDEIGVRGPANTRSDQFDIVLSQGRIRRQGYVATCRPARF